MSDCKHEKRSDYVLNHPRYVSYCQNCDADFTKFELDTLERAERAETRVKELEAERDDAIAKLKHEHTPDCDKMFYDANENCTCYGAGR
jgi:hypothetical protein